MSVLQWHASVYLNCVTFSVNCVDRHVEVDPDKVALIWEKDEPGQQEYITYKLVRKLKFLKLKLVLFQSFFGPFWYFLSNSYENLGLFNKAVRARPFYGLAKEICLGLLFTLIELMKSSYSQLLLGAGNLTFAQP